jgi:hypothetical protein
MREEETMLKRHILGIVWKALGLAVMVAAIGATYPSRAIGQANAPARLPATPAKPGFDITRFASNGGIFKTFYVERSEALQKVLQDGRVAQDTPVLVTATAGGNLALLTDQMVFHHLAQGRAGGKDWLAAF